MIAITQRRLENDEMTAACVQPAVEGGRAKLQSRYRKGMGRGAVMAINDGYL